MADLMFSAKVSHVGSFVNAVNAWIGEVNDDFFHQLPHFKGLKDIEALVNGAERGDVAAIQATGKLLDYFITSTSDLVKRMKTVTLFDDSATMSFMAK